MRIPVVPIGNSRGIRLPKAILDQLDIKDQVDLEVVDSQIVLRPVASRPRQGWDEQFQAMARNGDDSLLVADGTGEDFEWEW